MPTSTMLLLKPEDFEKIPETGSYVSTSKTRDYRGNIITSLTGYEEIRMARRLGLYPTSSAEWGKSRKYFQDNPDKEFHGKTGKEIEDSYISREVERTGTFILSRENREFPRDAHDLLKQVGFDGETALLDFPWVQEDDDIFIPSPRTRIIDVSGKLPLKDGYGQEYDWDLGIFTEVGPEPNPEYHGAHQSIALNGIRKLPGKAWQLLRGEFGRCSYGYRRFKITASCEWVPSDSGSSVVARLSSGNDPSEFLNKTTTLLVRQEIINMCEKYGVDPEELIWELK